MDSCCFCLRYLDVELEVRINGLLINGVLVGVITHLLTFY